MDHPHLLPLLCIIPYSIKTFLMKYPAIIPFVTFFSAYYLAYLFLPSKSVFACEPNNQKTSEKK